MFVFLPRQADLGLGQCQVACHTQQHRNVFQVNPVCVCVFIYVVFHLRVSSRNVRDAINITSFVAGAPDSNARELPPHTHTYTQIKWHCVRAHPIHPLIGDDRRVSCVPLNGTKHARPFSTSIQTGACGPALPIPKLWRSAARMARRQPRRRRLRRQAGGGASGGNWRDATPKSVYKSYGKQYARQMNKNTQIVDEVRSGRLGAICID